MAIKVLVIDDSALMRSLLTEIINGAPDLQVVGSAPDEAATVKWLLEGDEACELVIIDIDLRSGSGLTPWPAGPVTPHSHWIRPCFSA